MYLTTWVDNHFLALQSAGTALSFMMLIKFIKKFNLHWRIQLSMCLDITCLLLLRGGHLLNTSPPSVKTTFPTVERVLNRYWLLVFLEPLQVLVVGWSTSWLWRWCLYQPGCSDLAPPRLQLTNCWRQGRSKSAAARHHSAAGRSSPVLLLIAHCWQIERKRYKHTKTNKSCRLDNTHICSSKILHTNTKTAPDTTTENTILCQSPKNFCAAEKTAKNTIKANSVNMLHEE